MVSRATVTSKVHRTDSRHELVAVHVTVVVPSGNALPEGGRHVTLAGVAQRSPVVVGCGYVTEAKLPSQTQLVRLDGH
jgi:hypothetical protein